MREAKKERDPSIIASSIDGAIKLLTKGCTNQKACSKLFNFGILDQSNKYLQVDFGLSVYAECLSVLRNRL